MLMQEIHDVVGIAEAVKILGVTKNWIYDHTTRSEPFLPHYKYCGLKFSRKELDEFKQQHSRTARQKK